METLQAKVDIEVPFHDIGMMKAVWHGHYAQYFEIAHCRLLGAIDFNCYEMAQTNYTWAVTDMRIRFTKTGGMCLAFPDFLIQQFSKMTGRAYVIPSNI